MRQPGPRATLVWPALAVIAALDVAGTVLFSVSTTKGLISIVAVLISFVPVFVALLARVRPARAARQRIQSPAPRSRSRRRRRSSRRAAAQTLKRMFSTSPSWTTYSLPSRRCSPRFTTSAREPQLDEVLPADHLAADEAAGDVGVDRLGGVERGLAVAERPRARLLVAGGEERDEVERVLAASPRSRRARTARRRGTPPPPRRRARPAPPRARGRCRPGPFDHDDDRLRRQRVELGRQRARRSPRPCRPPRRGRAAARARRPPCEASGHRTSPAGARARAAARRGRGRRRAARAGAPRPRPRIARPSSSASTWRRLPSSCGPVPGTSTTRIAAGVTFRAFSTAATCGSRSSAIGAMPTCSFRSCAATPALVSALKSAVCPAPGAPTIPTSSPTTKVS